jgi:DNA-binding response OmpR family regulator
MTASALPLVVRLGRVMAEYRFYFFSSQSTMFDNTTHTFDGDANAVAVAISHLRDKIHIEIWEGNRKVAIVPENHPAPD